MYLRSINIDLKSIDNLNETVIHIGCMYAKDKTTKNDIFSGIWDYIKQLKTTTYDKKKLYYYGKRNDTLGKNKYIQSNQQTIAREYASFNTRLFLRCQDGKCENWKTFMLDILAAQGIKENK